MARGPRSSQFQNLFNEHSPYCANIFKSIFWHKNWQGGGELLLKNAQYIVTPTKHDIARA